MANKTLFIKTDSRPDLPMGCRLRTPELDYTCKRTINLGPHKAKEIPLVLGKERPPKTGVCGQRRESPESRCGGTIRMSDPGM